MSVVGPGKAVLVVTDLDGTYHGDASAAAAFNDEYALSLSSEFATHKTVKARFWPCLEPFLVRRSLKSFKLLPPRPTAVLHADRRNDVFVTHKVFSKSLCRSQLPHRSINLSFTITNIENKLTDLCGN